jgi:hypothetical protein
MKKILPLLALLFLAFQLGFSQQGTPTLPGIVKTTEQAKTNVFDMNIKGITTVEQARILDAALLAKQGILSAVTNPTTHICRVEVLKKITERHLQEVVGAAGFKIAKTFDE